MRHPVSSITSIDRVLTARCHLGREDVVAAAGVVTKAIYSHTCKSEKSHGPFSSGVEVDISISKTRI